MMRVLIVEEVRAMCEVIATVLRSQPDIEIAGCATSLDEALAQVEQCDVALVNAAVQHGNSPLFIRTLRKRAPNAKVVLMGVARNQQEIMQSIEAGASGYVLKDDSLDELLKNIRAAFNNEALVSPPVAATLMSYIAELAELDQALPRAAYAPELLTRREREVLNLVQQGLTNQEIAERLVIELGTVKNHVHSILRKLNVNSRRDAVHVSRLGGAWSFDEKNQVGQRFPKGLNQPGLYSSMGLSS
jgi:two-component system, NarL family, nitrate/nitrite response regulator NarL